MAAKPASTTLYNYAATITAWYTKEGSTANG